MQEEEQRLGGSDQGPGQVEHPDYSGCRGKRTAARWHRLLPCSALVPQPSVIHDVQQKLESLSSSSSPDQTCFFFFFFFFFPSPDPLEWSRDASLTTFATGATACCLHANSITVCSVHCIECSDLCIDNTWLAVYTMQNLY